jgi:hypothetical protein
MKRPIALLSAAVCATIPAPAQAVVTTCKKPPCKRAQIRPHLARLNKIAHCESRNHWHLDGAFDGGLQFEPTAWRQTGSRYRYAYQAPVLEQRYRAVVWASRIGWAWGSTAGWPTCAR